MARKQLSLFGKSETWPEGFRYQTNVVPPDEEAALLEQVRGLPFKEFEFQGFVGKRRTVSYGWRYDFNERALQKADDIPAFLHSLRERAGAFAGLPATQKAARRNIYATGSIDRERIGTQVYFKGRIRCRWEMTDHAVISHINGVG